MSMNIARLETNQNFPGTWSKIKSKIYKYFVFCKKNTKISIYIQSGGAHAHENKEHVHMLASCVCVLTSQPGGREIEYM